MTTYRKPCNPACVFFRAIAQQVRRAKWRHIQSIGRIVAHGRPLGVYFHPTNGAY